MSAPMASTFGEALLLLNKWKSESTRVVMLQAFMCPPHGGSDLTSGILSRTTGHIGQIEETTGTFTVASEHSDFAMVSPSGCVFGYNANFPLPPTLARFLPKEWDSLLAITFPNRTMLIIFAI